MQHQDEPMLFDDIKPGMWVIVISEEKFLAKVKHKSTDAPTQLIKVLMQKKSTGQKSHHIKHKLTRMEKRRKSGYGNIEIHFIDISFVKSRKQL